MGPGRVPRAWPRPVFAETVEGRQGSGAKTWQEWPRRRKGDEPPPLQVQAGPVPRLLHTRPCRPCCGTKHPKTQWLTPTITYLSPYHFGLGSCIALALAASAVPACLWVSRRLAWASRGRGERQWKVTVTPETGVQCWHDPSCLILPVKTRSSQASQQCAGLPVDSPPS